MVQIPETVSALLRSLFRAVAVYAAGAWVAIEVVDFAVRQYGLSQFLVDVAVIVAFAGGMVTAVLVWFHGEAGRQKIPATEIVIVGSIVVATGITLFYLRSSNGPVEFDDLDGYRLVLEYRDTVNEDTAGHIFSIHQPMDGIELIEGGDRGIFTLVPSEGEIRGPIMQAQFDGHPAMFFDPPDGDFVRVTFVLAFEPADISKLVEIGAVHDSATIDTEGLNLNIDTRITITEQEHGATIRINEIGSVK